MAMGSSSDAVEGSIRSELEPSTTGAIGWPLYPPIAIDRRVATRHQEIYPNGGLHHYFDTWGDTVKSLFDGGWNILCRYSIPDLAGVTKARAIS
jgi:hypothetical protein